jgi:hypothetical protein
MVRGAEVTRIGYGCKEELGDAHRQCAEAWFRIKGDRYTSLALSSCAASVLLDCFQYSNVVVKMHVKSISNRFPKNVLQRYLGRAGGSTAVATRPKDLFGLV